MSSPREDERIYPKAEQESEAQAFLEVYDVLQTLIKSKSLLIHLNDVKNALIPTNSTSNQTSEEILEKSITKQLYQQYKASKLLEFKEHFTQTESWRYFPAMYRSLRTRMPPNVKLNVLPNHPEIRGIVVKWNKDNQSLIQSELSLQDPRVQQYILAQFSNAYQHFSIPGTQIKETHGSSCHRMTTHLQIKSQ